MKKLLIFSALAITFIATASQMRISKVKVPENILQAFKVKFPDAEDKRWKMKNHIYIVNARKKEGDFKAVFSEDGKWLKTTKDIESANVPSEVKASFENSKFKDWVVQGVKQVDSSNNPTVYDFEIDNEFQFTGLDYMAFKELLDVYISSEGKIMNEYYGSPIAKASSN